MQANSGGVCLSIKKAEFKALKKMKLSYPLLLRIRARRDKVIFNSVTCSLLMTHALLLHPGGCIEKAVQAGKSLGHR